MVFGCHATLPQRVLLAGELRDIVWTSALDTKLPNSATHTKGMSGMHKTLFHVTWYKTTWNSQTEGFVQNASNFLPFLLAKARSVRINSLIGNLTRVNGKKEETKRNVYLRLLTSSTKAQLWSISRREQKWNVQKFKANLQGLQRGLKSACVGPAGKYVNSTCWTCRANSFELQRNRTIILDSRLLGPDPDNILTSLREKKNPLLHNVNPFILPCDTIIFVLSFTNFAVFMLTIRLKKRKHNYGERNTCL